MGFIHTLYYYQVEKSIEDAKKEEARIARENQQKSKNARRRLPPSNSNSYAGSTNSDYANIDAEDLEDSFGL